MKQHDHRDDRTSSRSNQTNNSINENWNDVIIKLFLKETDEQSNDFKDERIYYNYNEKKYIISKCLKLKQENSQVNVIENSWQNIQTNVERTSLIRLITKTFDELKN